MLNDTLRVSPQGDWLISDEAKFYINVVLVCFLLTLICLTGVVTNSITLGLFWHLGAKDCVTVVILFLAFSDLWVCIFGLVHTASTMGMMINPNYKIDFFALFYISGWMRSVFSDVSLLIALYASIQRCMCVIKPLHFKDKFTPKTSATACSLLFSLLIVSFMPVLMTQGLEQRLDPRTNTTRWMLWFADSRAEVEEYSNIFHILILSVLEMVGMVICAQLLAWRIKTTSKFRNSAKAMNNDDAQKLSHAERKIIKMMFTVAVMCIVLYSPTLMFIFWQLIVPEFDSIGKYSNLFPLVVCIVYLGSSLNAAINMFIYLNFHTKFRNAFRVRILRQKLSEDKG